MPERMVVSNARVEIPGGGTVTDIDFVSCSIRVSPGTMIKNCSVDSTSELEFVNG